MYKDIKGERKGKVKVVFVVDCIYRNNSDICTDFQRYDGYAPIMAYIGTEGCAVKFHGFRLNLK